MSGSMNARKIENKGGGKTFPRPDALESGNYPGRSVQVIGLGLQKQNPWKGEEKPPCMEVNLTYELADEFMLDEEGKEDTSKPRWISETMPLHSLEADLAKSTKRYRVLDPTESFGGDFTKLVDIPCSISIVQNVSKTKKNDDGTPKIYENIDGVSAMRSKDIDKAPALVNEPRVFNPYDPDYEIFLMLPKWIQEKITSALDFDEPLFEAAKERYEAEKNEPETENKNEQKSAPDVASDEEEDDVEW